MLRAVAITLTCAGLALTAAACGQSASGGDDPATLVPADVPIYVEGSVRPEGELRDDALAAAGKILRTDDPSGELRKQFDEALADGGGGLTWEKDFAPWLGEKAAFWATNLQAEDASYAVIAATTDAEAAASAIQRFEQEGGSAYEKRSHAGVDYEVNPDGEAAGIVDDFLVFGTEDALKRTVETADGGDSLAEADRYRDGIDDLEEDRLGLVFADSKLLWEAGTDPASEAVLEQIGRVLPFDKVGPTVASFHANGDVLAVDGVMLDVPEGPLRTLSSMLGGGRSELMPELPGDAWGTFVMPKLGEASKELFDDVAGVLGGAAVAGQVRSATGLDLEQDVFSWIGDVGVYVRGESEAEIDGALVIQSTDDGRASAAFGKIMGLIGKESGEPPAPIRLAGAESAFKIVAPDVPKPIVFARGAGRVVAAYGEEAAAAALDPATKLGDSELYGKGKDALGDGMEPSILLSMPSIVALVDAIGETDADWEKAKPYLESFDAITSGGKLDGDDVKSRITATLK